MVFRWKRTKTISNAPLHWWDSGGLVVVVMVIIMVKMGMIMVVVMAMIMVVVMMMAVDIRPLVHLGPHCQLIYSLNIILSCYKQENIF